MRLTVLGATGAWPEPGRPSSGFLVEADGFRLVLDLGYACLPRLLELVAAERVDAAVISHGHPDHCVDLNPLLRARALSGHARPPLPLYGPPGALDAVLALDAPEMLADAYRLDEFEPGAGWELGPFQVQTRPLPHSRRNAGIRLTAGGRVLAYTGDGGPGPEGAELARGADVFLAEATHVDEVPARNQGYLTSARTRGEQAAGAGVGRLVLTHLWPGTDPDAARTAAAAGYAGPIDVAGPGLVIDPL